MAGKSDAIIAASQKAGKTYAFNEGHDPNTPAEIWFQESAEGLVLFVVFYSMACRWSRCLGCNLPSRMSSRHVPFSAIMAQVDRLFADQRVRERAADIAKVIVSNNGSVLDQATFSSTALIYLVAKLNLHLPNLAVLSLETRPEYVEIEELEFLARALQEGNTPTTLEIAIGFEAFDERIRNQVFDKGLSLETFERLVQKAAPYGYHLKCYFMQKPAPGLTDEEAVADIHRAIDYLAAIATSAPMTINLHLNPTYVAAGTALEPAFREGRYSPPALLDVARAAAHGRGKALSIFIGLFDEGLAVPGGSFRKPGDELTAARLEQFNRTQDYDVLDQIVKEGK